MVPSVAATAAIGVALSQGALAASFSVSGQQFKVTADRLDGTGFAQYGAIDSGNTGQKTTPSRCRDQAREITNLCQSVVAPDSRSSADVKLTLKAGGGESGQGEQPLHRRRRPRRQRDVPRHRHRRRGRGRHQGSRDHEGRQGAANPYSFAQQADSVTLTDVKQPAWATTAGTFKLSGLNMSLSKGQGVLLGTPWAGGGAWLPPPVHASLRPRPRARTTSPSQQCRPRELFSMSAETPAARGQFSQLAAAVPCLARQAAVLGGPVHAARRAADRLPSRTPTCSSAPDARAWRPPRVPDPSSSACCWSSWA